jgi:hypothetical protein
MPDFVSLWFSRGVSRGIAVEFAKHLPKRTQQRIMEAIQALGEDASS